MTKKKTTGKATKARKRAPSVHKIKSLRRQLDILDAWLLGPAGRDLAFVLSALRGPDSGDPDGVTKAVTTEVIRTKAFPKLKACGASMVWNMAHPGTRYDRNAGAGVSRHFHSHVESAAKALGL